MHPQMPRWLIAAALILPLLPAGGALGAEASESASSAPVEPGPLPTPSIVFILHERGPATGVLAAFDRVSGQLGELEVDVRVERGARLASRRAEAERARRYFEASDVAAVFWFEPAGSSLIVYGIARGEQNVFVRNVSVTDTPAVDVEAVSVALRAMLGAALEGEPLGQVAEVGAEVVPPPPTRPRPAPAAPTELPPIEPEVWVHLSGVATWLAREPEPQLGMALAAEFRWQHLSILLDGSGHAPKRVDGPGADAVLDRFRVGLHGGYTRFEGILGATVAARLAVELLHRRTHVEAEGLTATAEDRRVFPVVGASVTGHARLTGRLSAFVTASMDAAPSHELRIVEPDNVRGIRLLSLRPALALGVALR